LDSRNVELLDHVGEIESNLGRWPEGRERFLAARALAPGDPDACSWLAADAERREDYAEAARILSSSTALAQDPGLHVRLSYYLSQAGRLPDAVAVLEKAHARWPGNDRVGYYLALGYDDLKRRDKAIETMRAVVELKSDWRDARYQLGVLL